MHFHSNLNPFPEDGRDYKTIDYAPTPIQIETAPFNLQQFNIYKRFNQPPSSVKNNPWQKAQKEKREKLAHQRREQKIIVEKTVAIKNQMMQD